MTARQILSTLASQFNTQYSSSGFIANYDSFTDTLSFNQLLDATSSDFYLADTDTGIDFSPCRFRPRVRLSRRACCCLAQVFSA